MIVVDGMSDESFFDGFETDGVFLLNKLRVLENMKRLVSSKSRIAYFNLLEIKIKIVTYSDVIGGSVFEICELYFIKRGSFFCVI